MERKESTVMESSSGVGQLSDIATEMHLSIVDLAGERAWSDTRESWLARAARRAGISYRAAKSLFYKEQADPKFSVVYRVRQARERKEVICEPSIMELRTQIEELSARIEAMADRVSL